MSTFARTGLETADTTDALPDDYHDIEMDDTGAGLLVYGVVTEDRPDTDVDDAGAVAVARELIGFADVSDWNAISEVLYQRGYHIDVVDDLPTYSDDVLYRHFVA